MSRLLITGARTHDGHGFIGERDVLVSDGTVQAVSASPLSTVDARRVDGAGLVLSPGFIDVHNMTRLPSQLVAADGINLLAQGVTTTVIGNCGMSGDYLSPSDVASRAQELRGQPLALNVGNLVGHGSVRRLVTSEPGPLDEDQRTRLAALLRAGMAEGALGVSLGLMYEPGWHADAEELAAVARAVGAQDRVLAIHLRSEGDGVADAVTEAIALAEHCRVVILHLKVCGPRNWPEFPRVAAEVRAGAERTGRLYTTYYPYTHTNTALRALIPQAAAGVEPAQAERIVEERGLQVLAAHGWGDVLLVGNVGPDLVGMTVAEYAQRAGRSPYAALTEILATAPQARAVFRDVAVVDDVRVESRWPFSMPGSDAYVFSTGECVAEHPRNYGAIVGSLRWALDGTGDLGECIRTLTSLPAQVYRIPDRGLLAEGRPADLTLLDPTRLAAPADMTNPCRLAEGVVVTVVGGDIAYERGAVTGHRGGTGISYTPGTDSEEAS